ncbi:hypothetical protein HNP84_001451 [Thermocatellispora tengchongensis]|uniref:Pectate lyase superfamily protein domain-containing protein n=1 Tax=Thermocatellispora tengchongensis TaxID=1073253 RepID=A0A840NW41_9ACTN|nr:hypothetical protein [Thermocatellispora tengchongensis]MBB5131738.1 hypothetical protein [Thermocatellispora tengchongensis]
MTHASIPPMSRRRLLGYAGAGATGAYLLGAVPAPAHADTGQAETARTGTALQVASAAAVAGQHVPAKHTALRTDGYAEPGDGGGALYRRLPAAPATPDRWHLKSADGAWWEIADDVVSVRALGAKGDYDEESGTGSDDTEALLAAARLNRVIYVPGTDKTYRCTQQITLLNDGTTWYGDGYRSKITLFSVASGAGALIGIRGDAPTTADGPPARTVRGVRVSGLHLDTRDSKNNNGLGGSFLADVQVDDMYFSRIGRKALTFQYHCRNVRCRDITIYSTATEPGSTFSAISVEGQTAGVDLSYYPGGVKSTADLQGADMADIRFTRVHCAATGYNGIVVSNAYRVSFDDIDFGDTSGAGSFVIFTRLVRDSHVRGIRGGDTRRRMIFFDANVRNCSVRDFHFGATLGTGGDGRAIHCAGPSNLFADGSFAHRNAATQEAVLVTGAAVTLRGLEVRECASAFVLNGPPAAEGLTLTDSRFTTAGAAAFRVKGPRTVIRDNRFDVAGAPFAGRFEGPDNQCVGNTVAGTGDRRLIVTAGASALIALNTFGQGSKISFEGGTLYAGACFGNTGLDGIAPNHLPMGGGALHVDGSGRLRVKTGPFTSDTDGVVVGSQT